MKIPTIDLSRCTLCEGCVAACPEVFVVNEAGYLEIVDMDEYPEDCVNDAIKYCPEDCIDWEASPT